MKAGITFIFLIALLSLLSCSGDTADNKTPKTDAKQSAPAQPTVPYPNSPPAQDIQPDLHVSEQSYFRSQRNIRAPKRTVTL